MGRFRFAVQPGWLALHAVSVVMIVTMVLLGRWQLIVSDDKGFDIQNFGYALQWWAFSVFVVIMWGRAMRDALRRQPGSAGSAGETVTMPEPRAIREETPSYRRYVMPTAETNAKNSDDPIHNAYNDFLARLAADDADEAQS